MLAGEHLGMCFEPLGAVTVAVENYCGSLNLRSKLVFVNNIFSNVLQVIFLKGVKRLGVN